MLRINNSEASPRFPIKLYSRRKRMRGGGRDRLGYMNVGVGKRKSQD